MKMRSTKNHESGSALLVSLMVIAGLSLLGLGFVAISETESAISVNERNYTQTLQVAEAGARTVAEWFNAPAWALANGLMPDQAVYGNTIKQRREIASGYVGYYKQDPTTLLCNIPFSQDDDRFYGANPNSADIRITETTAPAFLRQFNERLFNDSLEGGRIVEIRVFGPPVVAGTTTTTAAGLRFWNRNVGVRYGLATIAVTAEKTRPGSNNVVARRTVLIVVAELPLPGAEGPLQSHSGTTTAGNFRVHWGKAISNANIQVNRLHTSLPWHNAWDRIQFQEGYAASYEKGEPDYLFELINKGFEDPWFEVRARGTSTPPTPNPAVSGTVQLWTYGSPNNSETAVGNSGWSGHFQLQDQDDTLGKTRRNVLFTRPVYEIWKQIAMAGAGQQGIYYMRYVSGSGDTSVWRDTRGVTKQWWQWVNIYAGGFEGFFFFDTTDGSNPQLPNGGTNTTVLTTPMSVSNSAAAPIPGGGGNGFKMRGFFFMNMQSWGSTGLQVQGDYFNYPGEPFQDIGVHFANTPNGKLLCTGSATGPTPVECDTNPPGSTPWLRNFTNRQWDYQDVNGNGRFDVVVAQNTAAIVTPGIDTPDIPPNTEYFIVPYSDACGAAGGVGTTCSDPHEPYLNLIYPFPNAMQSGGDPVPVVVRWEAQNLGSQTRRAKTKTGTTPTTCNAASSLAACTSNSYDRVGPLVILGNQPSDGPVLEGIIYNEGNYEGAGQPAFFGAVLIQGTVRGSGTPYVYFDESLSRGDWHEKFENLPRTIMTSIETDQ